MLLVSDMIRCPQGGILVVDGVVLSAWTEAYDEAAVTLLGNAVAEASHRHPDALAAIGIYRIKRLREMPSAETRARLAAMGKSQPFKVMVTVLDSSGFGNALIRLFLTGLTNLLGKNSPMTIAESIDVGLSQVAATGIDISKLRPALVMLTTEVIGVSVINAT